LVQLEIKRWTCANMYIVKMNVLCAIMSFPIIMSSKSSKHVKKLLFILLHTSYHNHYLFAHCAPFINMTMDMYILLFKGWRSYVHMFCLISMLNPPQPKPNNLWVFYYYFPQIMFEKLVEIIVLVELVAQCSPHAKLHSTSKNCIYHQPWWLCVAIPWLGSANVASSFKCWKSLIFFTKRSCVISSKRLCNLHACSTSSSMELYQIQACWSLG